GCKTRKQAYDWHYKAIETILESVSPMPPEKMGDNSAGNPRAYCPLCRGSSNNISGLEGFAYPEGLRRHLEGSFNARKCDVMKAALALALEHVADLADPNTLKLGPIS